MLALPLHKSNMLQTTKVAYDDTHPFLIGLLLIYTERNEEKGAKDNLRWAKVPMTTHPVLEKEGCVGISYLIIC